MKTGIIGCGNMGAGMAHRFLALKQQVSCFDPDAEKLSSLQHAGCLVTNSACEFQGTKFKGTN